MVAGKHEREIRGPLTSTTNQRAEVAAAINALYRLKPPFQPKDKRRVVVYSDSKYLVDAFGEEWINGWDNNGWLNSKGKPIANRAEWETLLALTRYPWIEVTFRWVRGHHKSRLNNRADELANMAREEATKGRKIYPGEYFPETSIETDEDQTYSIGDYVGMNKK